MPAREIRKVKSNPEDIREIRRWLNNEFNQGNLSSGDFIDLMELLRVAEMNALLNERREFNTTPIPVSTMN
jgi:hypothetical protein